MSAALRLVAVVITLAVTSLSSLLLDRETSATIPPPSDTPTPTPTTIFATWGDNDCNGPSNVLDVLLVLLHVADLGQGTPGPCGPVGETVTVDNVPRLWGDTDCNGAVDNKDIADQLKDLTRLPFPQTGGDCPQFGSSPAVQP
jgi:hypothetical protein